LQKKEISEAVIKRLPKYYRYLTEMDKAGIQKVSSKELSEKMGLNASQIRQDFNCFGGFGQQGYGYNVKTLRHQMANILGLMNSYKAVLIGAGNIGQAVINYAGFRNEGFNIIAAFDKNDKIIGSSINGVKVYDIAQLHDFISKNKVDIAVIATPKERAQQVADIAMDAGIRGIWNFATVDLKIKDGVYVENVHLSDSLNVLLFKTSNEY